MRAQNKPINITTKWLDNLPTPPEKRVDYFDQKVTGLVLRVSPTGRRVWSVLFRVKGQSKKRRLTLDPIENMNLGQAQEKAREVILEASRGNDPAFQKQIDMAAPTFAFLAQEYLRRHAVNKKSRKEDERIIAKELLPLWGERRATTLKRRDVIDLLDGINERPAPIMANRTLALARKMFNFAIERDLAETNPCLQVRAPGKEKSRDRVLSEGEIRAFWGLLDNAEMAEGTRQALRLILVTAQRAGEVVASEWKEFDLETGWWTIPAEKAKNGLAHRVPLNSIAMGILKQIPHREGFLFPAPWGSGHIERTSLAHATRKNRAVFAIEPFTPHDLRRTAATHMTSAGVDYLVVSKLLNHVQSGVTATYIRYGYDGEKKKAMEVWGEKLKRNFQTD